MNLQEQISRIKSMMGLINETVDDACKLKNINVDTLESYWSNNTKTEQEKISEVENFVKPIFTEAKNYMLKYTESDWFNKKVQEKFAKNNPNLEKYKNSVIKWQDEVKKLESTNSEQLTKAKKTLKFFSDMVKETEENINWDETQKNELKKFINEVSLVFSLTCESGKGGFVTPTDFNKVNFCTKNIFPNNVNKNEVMLILVHEFNHCISFYFNNKGIDYLPQDAKGPTFSVSTDINYGNDSSENASRVQNLKRLLGVTDFGTLENFIKLIKDNVKIKINNQVHNNVVYEDNLMKIPFKSSSNITLLNFDFFINGTDAYDVKILFNAFSKTVKDEYDSYIEVDLNKLYYYTQEFAKTNTNDDLNYA